MHVLMPHLRHLHRLNSVHLSPDRKVKNYIHRGIAMSAKKSSPVCTFSTTRCAKNAADLNYRKRFQTASLHGQIALITGSRLKIGYQATLMMLRAGATVIATTRFPVDAAIRYSREEDYAVWGDRLHIHGLDLRHIPSVELFAGYVEQRYGRLDILINNAAQTVRRPPGFYAHLIENEKNGHTALVQRGQNLLADHEACKKQIPSLCNSNTGKERALSPAWHNQRPE